MKKRLIIICAFFFLILPTVVFASGLVGINELRAFFSNNTDLFTYNGLVRDYGSGQPITVNGIISVVAVDSAAGASEKYILTTDSSPIYTLNLANRPEGSLLESPVSITGNVVGNVITVSTINSWEGAPNIKAPTDLTIGPRSFLVIPFNFSGESGQPPIINLASVGNYFQEASYSRLTMTGTTTPVLTLSGTSSNACANSYLTTWVNLANTAARARGYEPNNYNHVIYIWPYTSSCGFYGEGDLNGRLVWLNGWADTDAVSHELGHNIQNTDCGATWCHAYALNCGSKSIDIESRCSIVNGQDNYDVMNAIDVPNSTNPQHFSSGWKNYFGWFNTNIQDITVSGTYFLDPLETTNGIKALRIAKGSDFYYIDYRTATGFDNQSFFQTNAGVSIHLWKAANNAPGLIDTSPGDSNFDNASLKVNSTFTDDTNASRVISIQRLSDLNGQARLSISIITPVNSPTVSITSPTNGPVSGFVTIQSTATSNNGTISKVQYYIDNQLAADSLSSSPYTYYWNSTARVNGNHLVTAVAIDSQGNSATTSININVQNSGPKFKSCYLSTPSTSVPVGMPVVINYAGTMSIADGTDNNVSLILEKPDLTKISPIPTSITSPANSHYPDYSGGREVGSSTTGRYFYLSGACNIGSNPGTCMATTTFTNLPIGTYNISCNMANYLPTKIARCTGRPSASVYGGTDLTKVDTGPCSPDTLHPDHVRIVIY